PASTAPLPRDRGEMRPCGYRSLMPPLACESINLPVPPNVVQELPSTSCSTSLPVLLRSVQLQCRLSCMPRRGPRLVRGRRTELTRAAPSMCVLCSTGTDIHG